MDSGSCDMSDETGSARFGRVDSGSWERDISELVFMKTGIPPSGHLQQTSFWKLQDSKESEQMQSSSMCDSKEAATAGSSILAADSVASEGAAEAAGGVVSASLLHCMDSPDHLLVEREQPARAFRAALAVNSSGSAASVLQPRDRNSSATEFRSSGGTELQVSTGPIPLV